MQSGNNFNKAIFLKRILFSNLRRPAFPYKLTFALTYRCNLKCKTCLIWSKEPRPELSFDEICRFFKKTNDFSWVDLTGGEIFLRDDLPEIADIILANCRSLCILHFPTNGQLTEKIIRTAEKIHRQNRVVLIATVSIDGPEELHNNIRGAEDAWRRAVETFTGLKKIGLRHAYIGYTISEHNLGKIDETISAIKKIYPRLTYDDLHVNFFHASEHYLNNTSMNFSSEDLILKELQGLQKNKQKRRIKTILEKQYFRMAPRYLSSRKMPVKCQALRASLFMDPYGDIYPCTIYSRKISNIRDIHYDLRKLWGGGGTVSLTRSEILNKKCGGCWTPCEAYPSLLGSLKACLKAARHASA